MGKNGFLERQRERDQKILDAGYRLEALASVAALENGKVEFVEED